MCHTFSHSLHVHECTAQRNATTVEGLCEQRGRTGFIRQRVLPLDAIGRKPGRPCTDLC